MVCSTKFWQKPDREISIVRSHITAKDYCIQVPLKLKRGLRFPDGHIKSRLFTVRPEKVNGKYVCSFVERLGYGSPEWTDPKTGEITWGLGDRYFMPCVPFEDFSPLPKLLKRMSDQTYKIAQQYTPLKALTIDYKCK